MRKKVEKDYDVGDVPFLVAVGLHDRSCSTDQVIRGLYGGEAIFDAVGSPGRPRGRRFFDGCNTRVSAVATLDEVRPWREEPATLFVWDHPAPQSTWPDDLLPIDHRLSFRDDGAAFWR